MEEYESGDSENKIFIAVGKEAKERKATLKWAMQKAKGKMISIVYLHVPAQMIPLPNGMKAPLRAVGAAHVRAFHDKERLEIFKMLDDCLHMCEQNGVPAEKVYIEGDSIAEGLVELISQRRIVELVMGAAAENRYYLRKMVAPMSRKANYVLHCAPDFCHIWFVYKGRVIHVREGVKTASPNVENNKSKSIGNSEPSINLPVAEPACSSSTWTSTKHLGSSINTLPAEPVLSSSWTPTRDHDSSANSPPAEPNCSSSSTWILTKHHGSPTSELANAVNNDPYDQLKQALAEVEKSRRAIYEESNRRRKAEEEAKLAICKAKEAEDELVQVTVELKDTKTQLDKLTEKLLESSDLTLSLERKIELCSLRVEEMKEKMLLAVELLQKYKEERDKLEVEWDNTLQVAQELRKRLAQEPSISHAPKFFTELSFVDLEKATNYFDPSLKIWEGPYASIYKGVLCHTEVTMKIIQPNSLLGLQEFQLEVDVLSKLRHPNVVTLIGVCPEYWALVYEYLPNGSLEDRLSCKDDTLPLSWETRIQIATEICSVLNFLHSSQPSTIIHGNLSTETLLLDANFICKLTDFSACHVTSNSRQFLTTEPKRNWLYSDPEFLETGQLTPKSDVYSFGIILLRLLTGKPAFGIVEEVLDALDMDDFYSMLDPSAGEWPFVRAKQLAYMALRCCDMSEKNRPDLASEVWHVLKPMKAPYGSLSSPLHLISEDKVPSYFLCPIFQEIMQDPHFAADGFTYEADALRGWFEGGHDTSPMTNLKLANYDLTPNRALRSAIQEWLQQHRCV